MQAALTFTFTTVTTKHTTNSKNLWVGDIEFDDEGYPVDEHYEFDFEDNNSGESEVWWHITDKNDWYMYSYIDLRVMEVM